MSIVLVGSTSGSCTLQEQAVAGTTVLTLPTTSGTILTSATPFSNGQGPAFSAYQTPSQSLSTGFQKILFTTEEFDTNNNFASSRFTPTVAGYYQLSSYVRTNGAPGNEFSLFLAKNTNNSYKMGNSTGQTGGITASGISIIAYANGTTDYFEIWLYAGGSCTTSGGETYTWFTGSQIRGA
jgi:hypothetical protein